MYALGCFTAVVLIGGMLLGGIKLIVDIISTSSTNSKMDEISKDNERLMWEEFRKNK